MPSSMEALLYSQFDRINWCGYCDEREFLVANFFSSIKVCNSSLHWKKCMANFQFTVYTKNANNHHGNCLNEFTDGVQAQVSLIYTIYKFHFKLFIFCSFILKWIIANVMHLYENKTSHLRCSQNAVYQSEKFIFVSTNLESHRKLQKIYYINSHHLYKLCNRIS